MKSLRLSSSLFVADDATAIKNANAVANSNARYSINGQKVNANYRGIVIENGKKKLVK